MSLLWFPFPAFGPSTAVTAARATLIVQLQFTPGVWTSVTNDVISEAGIRWTRGIVGNSPADRVAQTGLLEFTLRNDAGNSGGIAGWYSPNKATVRPGFTFGIPVRVLANAGGGDIPQWRGKLRTIDPDPGVAGPRRTHCTAQDCMGDLADADVRSIPPQVGQTEVQLLTAVLAALPTDSQPVATSLDTALDLYPYAFDDIAGGGKALDLINRVITSAQGFVYPQADGTFRYENRHTTFLRSSIFTLTDTALTGLVVPSSLGNVYNRVRVTTHPKTTKAGVLYALTGAQEIGPGQTITIWGEYADPTNSLKLIGGTSFLTPIVATTDYLANTLADGGGADFTSGIAITTYGFAASAKFDIVNTTTQSGYITKLQLRGAGIYDDAPPTVESYTTQSYGDRPLDLDLPYQANAAVAKDLADYLKSQYMRLGNQVDELVFNPQDSAALMALALTADIGSVVTVSEPQTGLTSVDVTILGIDMAATQGPIGPWLTCRYRVTPHALGSAFVLNDAARGVLDLSALGYA